MTITKKAIMMICVILSAAVGSAQQRITTSNIDVRATDNYLTVSADLVLDSLRLGKNQQIFITPIIKSGADAIVDLPSVLVNGRNMHISYQRGVLRNFKEIKRHDIAKEVERNNGKPQTVDYIARIPLQPWMRSHGASVAFVYDSCGCGTAYAQSISPDITIFSNPVEKMQALMLTPEVTELPVEVHEGKARVQFEVNRTELHADPYVCRNGQRIDNRSQLGLIDDSVKYALTDKNVELAGIRLCGYASPESPYLHNEELADGRSRALAEYLAERYQLPKSSVKYSSVPENWGEFRTEVLNSNEISEKEREQLLQLIDEPATSPEDFDRKEKILKTDPRFARLYRTKILPEWFPRLRATTFAIQTRLKPMSDAELAEVIKSTPEKMSLNQMYRVALLYPEGSDDFNRVIEIALKHYPNDPTAIINAATAYVNHGEYDRARALLVKAGDTPEANNLRGIVATADERYDDAIRYFEKAGELPAARQNLELLK